MLQPTESCGGPEFLKFLSELIGEELGVAPILEKELQVFCIEPELTQSPADLSRIGIVGRGSGPALIACSVNKLQEAAVFEKQSRFCEL